MLAWFACVWGLGHLTAAMWGELPRVWGIRADLLLLSLGLMPELLSLAWVPDTALGLLTCAVMVLTWRLCQPAISVEPSSQWRIWLLLGLSMGLAGLSKYTAIMLALSVTLVLWHVHGVKWVRSSGFMLALPLAVMMVIPVFYWNAHHDWSSFKYQLGHAQGQIQWQWLPFARFWCVSVLAYGLVLPWCWYKGWRCAPVASAKLSPIGPVHFSLYFAAPSMLLWINVSGHGSALPHWLQPMFISMVPLAGMGLLHWHQKRPLSVAVMLCCQGLMVGVMWLLMSSGGWPEALPQGSLSDVQAKAAFKPNPFADLHGWSNLASLAIEKAEQSGISHLGVMHWSLASRLAWYARPMPVRVVNSHHDAFDQWFGTLNPGDDLLLVQWSQMPFDLPVGPDQFQSCEARGQLSVKPWGWSISHFTLWACRHWQGLGLPS